MSKTFAAELREARNCNAFYQIKNRLLGLKKFLKTAFVRFISEPFPRNARDYAVFLRMKS